MKTNRFEGKAVLVTGAADGIGRVTALEFANEGASVILCDRDEHKGRQTCEELMAAGSRDSTFFRCDVGNAEDVATMFEQIRQRYGRLDIALNNAGVEGPLAPIHQQTIEAFDHVLAVNVRGTFLCLREELTLMRQRQSGVIINMASIAAHVGFPNCGIYTATKHAIMGLTKAAAMENASVGIRVCAISPGAVDTDMTNRFTGTEAVKQAMIAAIPIGRLCQPSEIARGVLFLASDDAALLTGQTLNVDGGWANVKP